MLSFSELTNEDRRKLRGIRDDGTKSPLDHVDFLRPHETFAIGLASLRAPGIPQPERTGVRAIEVSDDAFQVIYEVYGDAGAQMFRDKGFISDYEQAFENIAETDQPAVNYTVQTLRIPALHIDALWLHDTGDENNDKFIPVLTIPGLVKNRIYSRSQFFSQIKDAAANINSGDELSGG